MDSRIVSPTRRRVPVPLPDESEPLKQSIGLQKLDTKEKSFRYLDFAEGGANAALNKWGQFLQFSRLVADDRDRESWQYISVEPRHILRLEHIAPAKGSCRPDQEGHYSEEKRRTLGWEPNNPEWKSSVYHLNDSDAYQRRHDKFNALCMQKQGLGLRFSENTDISELQYYYRNDRWPEVRYTAEGKVKVVLQYYIENGQIIQDMCLTSESTEETELSLEFEFTTGIRIASGNMRGPEEKREDEHDFDHVLQQVLENKASGSQWKLKRGNYYAAASLFKDGQPKPFSLLRAGQQIGVPGCNINIRSNDSIMHRETFILGPGAKTKFTSAFKIEHIGTRNTPPQYFDISPRLELLQDRWWSFDTESSSFIFRRNLETILSHAMPLPRVKDEAYQPYVLHDHDLMNTFRTWGSSLNQVRYLLEIDKILQHPGKADEITTSHYRRRIREVIFGHFIWLLKYAESNGFPESILLHWSGKVMERSAEEFTHSANPINPAYPDDPPWPFEPELSKYDDKFRNCCQFLILLDACWTNYPDEEPLFTRIVEKFIKQAWEPIEMSKHRESHLWPDKLERLGEFPPPYARFPDGEDYVHCGYGGQDVHVYIITTQVLVWRAIKSVNRLLTLLPKDESRRGWMDPQTLDDKIVRNRTIEVFRRRVIDTSHDYFPDRFFSKIKGHLRESLLDQWSCDIVVPSFVEDFFLDDKDDLFTWTETLRHYDAFGDSPKTRSENTWESFMRYQIAIDRDRRELFRESFESRAYSAGLFTNETITPGSHCPYTTSWSIVTYLLSADHTELLYPQFVVSMDNDHHHIRGDRTSMFPLDSLIHAGVNPRANLGASIRQDGKKLGKKGNGLDMTAEDVRQLNDPPSYGEWYWFREPFFMKHKPPEFEMNKQFVEEFLESEKKWSWFWDTLEGKQRFVENMVNISHYNWGGDSSALIQPTRDGDFEFLQGTEAFMRLKAYRDRKVDKKRILVMEDCSIEHLIALMANIDFQEACHIGEFLSRMRLMDSHEMRFTEHTILPDNLWITEFNVNFITVPALNDVDLSRSSSYFSKKRAKFQSINDFESEYMMAEAAIGFRFIGDLHDRYWTCYVFYDFGSMELSSEARTQVADSDYGKTASQRKCLEGFLVRQALELVISETKRVLQVIAVSMGGSNEKSQTLFNPLLTEDDLSGENYFKTMNKNSVFYPWLLEVYGALRDKCIESRIVAEHWLSAEKTRKYKPRWSEKDQKTFGEKVMTSRLEVNSLCTKVEKMAKNLQERIDRIKTLKESLSSELGLREARTSTQLAQTVNLFAVVTTIYLPLTFSTSIVAIQDFHWPSPAKSLVKITLAVTFGTLILLMNLAFLRRNLAAVQFWAHRSIRRKMAGAPEPHRPKKSVYPEKRPAWKYWKECAQGLQEAEKRITLLTDNTIHDSKSDWWYWYFLAVFIIIVVPVQELTFIIHTLRRQQVEGAGPLKKLVRIPWAPIWVVQLAIVYVVILVGYAILFVVGLVHRAAVWLWTGSDIKKSHKGADPQADEKSLKFQTDTLLEVTKQVPWWKRPAKTMQFAIVAEALRAERIVDDHDLEKQGAS